MPLIIGTTGPLSSLREAGFQFYLFGGFAGSLHNIKFYCPKKLGEGGNSKLKTYCDWPHSYTCISSWRIYFPNAPDGRINECYHLNTS